MFYIMCTLDIVLLDKTTIQLAYIRCFLKSLQIKCTGCNEVSSNWHSFTSDDECESKGGRGTFNFANKCKFCSRDGTMSMYI